MSEDAHRAQREALGAYVLGHLSPSESAAVRAHLDGCAACRSEHDALAPLALALSEVDPDTLEELPRPGALLGSRIEAEIAALREDRRRRTALRRCLLVAAACLVLIAAFVAGSSFTDGGAPPAVPLEAVVVTSERPGITASADLVDHTWGVEIKLTATGLEDGATYTTTVDDDVREHPAGEFIGVDGVEIHCNMNASVLREDATGFTVWDSDGRPVLHAEL
jgi:predicted anti-sigma-YlaC factor YlaD